VAIGLLSLSKDKPLARRFIDFLAGAEGKAIFASHHYTVEEPR
jgi:ABC-type molybdate transport system substrate-binding protein